MTMICEQMGVRAKNGTDRLRTIWTPEMDRYFIDLMLDQVGKGNRVDDHLFSKRAWKQMTALFNTKFKFQYEKDVLKNRHKSLRNLYKSITKLLDQNGFSWNETRQMVTADNSVWDEYIKVHPDARSFRIKTIPYFNDLCLIYKSTTIDQKGNEFSLDDFLENSISESGTDDLLEGLKFAAKFLDDKEAGENIPVSSSHSAESGKDGTPNPSSVGEGTMLLLHDIQVDEDYGISISKEVMDDGPQTSPNVTGATSITTRSRTYWQPPMDRYFIDLMLEQVQKGNQVDGIFRKHAWMEMIALFNAKFGFNYDIDVLKNRYKTLRRQYNVIKNLLELDGFFWDDARQMVTASDYVWQDYIKAHTDARQFMTRPVPYYKDLCEICNDQSVDEGDCFSAQNLDQQIETKFVRTSRSSQSPGTSFSSEEKVADLQQSDYTDIKSIVCNQNKRHVESGSKSSVPKKPRVDDNSVACALREMVTAVSSLSEKKKDDENSNSIPIENVISAIQALPDMDEDLVLDACDFLEDEKKAKTFLALDVKLRKKWLTRKLRPQAEW